MRIHLLGLAGTIALLGACDFSGDFLFPGAIEGVPGVLHITAEDGGPLVPAVIPPDDPATPGVHEGNAAAEAATIYVELGPTGDASGSGATLNFEGTGGSVCIFTDPELVFWNQAVGSQGTANTNKWRYPDNPYDDGDIEVTAGLSVYYTGTEGDRMGNFAVQYQDSLGNTVPINLVACTITGNALGGINPTAHAGRGAPEYCTIANTQPGVRYTVALDVFSLPPDDNRLMFGILLADGGCGPALDNAKPVATTGLAEGLDEECIIRGEAIPPIEKQSQLYYGRANAPDPYPGSVEFEERFCSGEAMRGFCNTEAEEHAESGVPCTFFQPETVEEKCYCGDPRDTPTGGAF